MSHKELEKVITSLDETRYKKEASAVAVMDTKAIDCTKMKRVMKERSFLSNHNIHLEGVRASFIKHCLENVEVNSQNAVFKLSEIPAQIRFDGDQSYTIY
mmetsp:Transcript_41939/g.48558  ORF Transcript_41939/g.48558 Transcript_41939/m.48558 type:complete len:100 (-) Transcript_41939:130-429(-)